MERSVEGNPGYLSAAELHANAWAVMVVGSEC